MARPPEQPPCKDEKTNKWMVTFADVITLLMTFFIFLVTFATLNTDDLEQVQAYLVSAIGIVADNALHDRDSRDERDLFPTSPESHDEGRVTKKGEEMLAKRLDLLARQWDAATKVDLLRLQPTIEVHMVRWMGFDPDSDVIPREERRFLDDLALILRQHSTRIVVEGYSDDHADIDVDDREGYRIAGSRALAVALYLAQDGIDPGLITVESRGKYSPQSSGATPLERARNRCIGFLVQHADARADG